MSWILSYGRHGHIQSRNKGRGRDTSEEAVDEPNTGEDEMATSEEAVDEPNVRRREEEAILYEDCHEEA